MHVTELGMITLFKLLQLAKVEYLIVVTELGIIMLVRFLQLLKQSLSISFIESGRVMSFNSSQKAKALLAIFVTELGMTVIEQPKISVLLIVSIIALQLLRESYTGFPSDTIILLRPLQ